MPCKLLAEDFQQMVQPQLSHYLEKVVPILVLQFENEPLFCGKTLILSSKQLLFRDKTLSFQFQMNPLFCGKTLTFPPK